MTSILTSDIQHEQDVAMARRSAMRIAALLGFDPREQTRVATAVLEIASNSLRHAGRGKVEFIANLDSEPQKFVVRISDRGPGIPDVERVLNGAHQSGAGIGIAGARRLVESFDLQSSRSGTTVTLEKALPQKPARLGGEDLLAIRHELARQEPGDLVEELERRNGDLRHAIEELETKSWFLSHLGHEFRTPLNSILALCRLLLDHTDGPLTAEQEKQVTFIRRAGEELYELVNDLLDLAKAEAGKVTLHPAELQVHRLFSVLRGMLKPLVRSASVNLVFEDPSGIPPLRTDGSKLGQILRNLISNALKYTETGEVRVMASLADDGETVIFSVKDTGIGIAPENLDVIFQEFVQIDNPLQSRTKGTGLGLPLSRKLAELLGGDISVSSRLGAGSTFTLRIPPAAPREPVEYRA